MNEASISPFGEYFEIVPALDERTRDAAYRIRHQVYCEDLGFEAPRPDGRERDQYDAQALACLLRHKASDQFVGVTRLVFVPASAPQEPLPFERSCGASLYRGPFDPAKMPRHEIAEVSRLAVVRGFRRRRGEAQTPMPLFDEETAGARPRFPYIPIGLYLGAISLAHHAGVSTLFVLTEPRLAQHFAKFGVPVQTIGEPIEHRGLRVPSMIRVEAVLSGMTPLVSPIWREIETAMAAALPRADATSRRVVSLA